VGGKARKGKKKESPFSQRGASNPSSLRILLHHFGCPIGTSIEKEGERGNISKRKKRKKRKEGERRGRKLAWLLYFLEGIMRGEGKEGGGGSGKKGEREAVRKITSLFSSSIYPARSAKKPEEGRKGAQKKKKKNYDLLKIRSNSLSNLEDRQEGEKEKAMEKKKVRQSGCGAEVKLSSPIFARPDKTIGGEEGRKEKRSYRRRERWKKKKKKEIETGLAPYSARSSGTPLSRPTRPLVFYQHIREKKKRIRKGEKKRDRGGKKRSFPFLPASSTTYPCKNDDI